MAAYFAGKASKVARRIRQIADGHDVETSTITDPSQANESKSVTIIQSHTSADTISSRADVAGQQSSFAGQGTEDSDLPTASNDVQTTSNERQDPRVIPRDRELKISWEFGTILIVGFLVTFIAIMVLCGFIKYRPVLFSLFPTCALLGLLYLVADLSWSRYFDSEFDQRAYIE